MAKTDTLTVRLESAERIKLDQIAKAFNLRSAGEAVRYLLKQVRLNPEFMVCIKRIEDCVLAEDVVLLSAEEIKHFRQENIDLEPLLDCVCRVISDHCQLNGFPMPDVHCTLGTALTDLRSGGARSASLYLKSVFPSFWAAGESSPERIVRDMLELKKVLRYRMGFNETGEVFDISLGEVRRALTVQRKTVSWFQPKAAYNIYSTVLPAGSRPLVWDPSGGFGARMLGFYAAHRAGTYYTNEPARRTFDDLSRLAQDLGGALYPVRIGSEHGHPLIETNSLDLVFTSPPYFDKEKYFDEPSQCWYGRKEEEWITQYLDPTLANAHRYLKEDGLLKLNVDCHAPYLGSAERVGFTHVSTEPWKVRRDHFSRRKNKTHFNEEYLITWKK